MATIFIFFSLSFLSALLAWTGVLLKYTQKMGEKEERGCGRKVQEAEFYFWGGRRRERQDRMRGHRKDEIGERGLR